MNAAPSEDQKPVRNSLFKNRDFSLLFFGSSVSALGDQFTLVALPWLVLKLTNDSAALGLVLAVIAVESSFRPRVVNPYGDAYGLMQIALRVHARRVAAVGGRQRLFLVAPNIRIGVALLAQYGAGVRSGIRHALWRYSGGEYGYARKVLQLSALLQRNGAQL